MLGCFSAHAQDITPILASIEQNNLQLRTARETYAADIAEREAGNTLLGTTAIEYSPFFHRGIHGLASSELIVSQEITYPTLYRDRKQAIALQNSVYDYEYRTLRREILLEAAGLCHDLQYAHQEAALLAHRRATTDSILRIFERRLALGHATIMETERIRLDSMQLTTEWAMLQQEMDASRRALLTLNGGDLLPYLSSLDSIYQTEAEHSPLEKRIEPAHTTDYETLETLTAEAGIAAARHQEKLSRKEWLPGISVGYRRNTDLHVANGGFMVGLSFPLSSLSGKQRAARMQRSAAELRLAEARADAASRHESLIAESIRLQHTLSTYDLPLMWQSLSTLHRAVIGGELPVADYFAHVETIYAILQQRLKTERSLVKVLTDMQRESL